MNSLGVEFDHILEPADSFPHVNNTQETQMDKVDDLLNFTHNNDSAIGQLNPYLKDMQGLKIGKQFSGMNKGIMLARVEKKPSLNTGKNYGFHGNDQKYYNFKDSCNNCDLHNHDKYCLKLRCSIRFHNQIVLMNK